jgi:rubrerythrin
MDIFEYAMQMEKDGEAYYRDLAAKCNMAGLKKILTMLADDEVVHFQVFRNLRDHSATKLDGSTVIKDAKNVFTEMKGKETEFNLEGSEIDLYKRAIEVENKSEAFYKEKANEVDSEEAKRLFLEIADEEKNHAFLLENMVAFLTRPQTWLENAEFHHLDEY